MGAHVWFATIASVVVVSAVSLVGVATLAFRREAINRALLLLVSFAVGGLFGDAFIHLLPEAFDIWPTHLTASLAAAGGVLLFFVLEKFIRWRHCHAEPCEGHRSPLVAVNLVGDTIHNLLDGMIIGASYQVSMAVGVATTFAVVLHEIPQEIGDFGIFLHGGCSVRRALAYNFLSALAAVAGAVLALLVGERVQGFASVIIPVAAGGFIYIAGSDLIPELKHGTSIRTSLLQFVCIVAGVLAMAAIAFVK